MIGSHPSGYYHRAMVQRCIPRSVLGVLALIGAVLLAGCTGSSPAAQLPSAAELLSGSANAMRAVSTAAIAIDVDPAATVVPIRNAVGRITSDGQAEGTAVLALFNGPPLEYQLVVAADVLYLKGPTGGFTPLPLAAASGIYDPTAILDPDRGAAAMLSAADAATTQAREVSEGVDAFRVGATFRPEQVSALVPGVAGPVPGVVWLDAATQRLARAELTLPDGPTGKGGLVTVRFSDYDVPVSVAPPV